MPHIYIYKNQQLLEDREFSKDFYIDFAGKKLFWLFGGEKEWRTDNENDLVHDATLTEWATWLINLRSKSYFFQVIRPDWLLIVNDVKCERGFYDVINIVWQKIELTYYNYRFVFLFKPNEIEIEESPSLPRPTVSASER